MAGGPPDSEASIDSVAGAAASGPKPHHIHETCDSVTYYFMSELILRYQQEVLIIQPPEGEERVEKWGGGHRSLGHLV